MALFEFEFDADVAIFGKSGVTVRGAYVGLEIEAEHEGSFQVMGWRDLGARVFVVYAESAEKV